MTKVEKWLVGKPLVVKILASLVVVALGLGSIYLVMTVIVPAIYHLGYLFGQFLARVTG